MPTGPAATARLNHTATLLANGSVLLVGGFGAAALSSVELYNPASGLFTAVSPLSTARNLHTSTLLPSGKVLVVGGSDGTNFFSSSELFDPATKLFTFSGPLTNARYSHTANLLPNGKILITGGYNSGGYLASSELYDPATGTFSASGAMASAKDSQTATVLPNGNILVAAGFNGGFFSNAEVYDPISQTFFTTGSLSMGRAGNTSTLLPSGKVLVTGGVNSGVYLSAAELYDPGLATRPAFVPTLSLTQTLPRGRISTFSGSLLTGISESSRSNAQSSHSDFPLLSLLRQDNELLTVVPVRTWSATGASWTVPSSLPLGQYWGRVFVNGIASNGSPVSITDLGQSCASPATCSTGFCFNDVCCKSSCGGAAKLVP